MDKWTNEWVSECFEWMQSHFSSIFMFFLNYNLIICLYESDAQCSVHNVHTILVRSNAAFSFSHHRHRLFLHFDFSFCLAWRCGALVLLFICFMFDCFYLSHSISLAHKQTNSKVEKLLQIYFQHLYSYDQQCHLRSQSHHSYSGKWWKMKTVWFHTNRNVYSDLSEYIVGVIRHQTHHKLRASGYFLFLFICLCELKWQKERKRDSESWSSMFLQQMVIESEMNK